MLYLAGDLILKTLTRVAPKLTIKKLKKSSEIKIDSKTQLYNVIVLPLIKPVSLLVKLESEKEIMYAAKLKRAGVNLSPKEYYARAIIMSVISLFLSFLMLLIGARLLIFVTLILSVVIYIHFITEINDILKQKKEAIEWGLPSFIRSIIYKIGNNEDGSVKADLIDIFEDYYKVINSSKENLIFQYDIAVLITEMKSMNIEIALRNFDERVGMTPVTFLVQSLIGINRGENQNLRLETLASDMSKLAKENLKRELDKRPEKIKGVNLYLTIIGIITLVTPIVMHLIKGLGIFR